MTATVHAPSVVVRKPRRLLRRHLWLVPGLAIAIYANTQAELRGVGLAVLLIFGIVPHVPALLGARAVPLFNAMHHPAVPLALLLPAATGLLAPVWIVGALAWLSHIVVDWALGDGVRSEDGSRRGGPA